MLSRESELTASNPKSAVRLGCSVSEFGFAPHHSPTSLAIEPPLGLRNDTVIGSVRLLFLPPVPRCRAVTSRACSATSCSCRKCKNSSTVRSAQSLAARFSPRCSISSHSIAFALSIATRDARQQSQQQHMTPLLNRLLHPPLRRFVWNRRLRIGCPRLTSPRRLTFCLSSLPHCRNCCSVDDSEI